MTAIRQLGEVSLMKKRLLIVLFLTQLLFTACATTITKDLRLEGEDLPEAVARYWTYRVNNDLGMAYYYEHVSYTKMATRDFYMSRFVKNVRVDSFEILDIGKESGSEGYVPVKLRIKTSVIKGLPFPVPPQMENEITDLWVKKEGRWYRMNQTMTGLY